MKIILLLVIVIVAAIVGMSVSVSDQIFQARYNGDSDECSAGKASVVAADEGCKVWKILVLIDLSDHT